VGELYLGGAGLAVGYLGQEEQTRESFVAHPFGAEEGARLYRTGDLARYTEEGQIEFVGRGDGQVKLRGYRIEVGEIEAVLAQHARVWDCAVVLREEGAGGGQLVAYVVARTPPLPSSEELRRFVEGRLPSYMVPSAFVLLRVLPLTANGKLDRRMLPAPKGGDGQERTTYVAPRNPIEEILVGIWEDVLKVKQVGIYDNFSNLGGHSLLATQVMSRVHIALQADVPLRSLFEAPTVAGLAEQVEGALRSDQRVATPPLVPISRQQDLPLSFAQQRLWFLDQLRPGSTAYNVPLAVRLRGMLNVEALKWSLGEIVRRHESLRTTFHVKEGSPVQIVSPPEMFHLPLADLSGLASQLHEAEARRVAQQEVQRPFDLTSGPLLRTFLLRLSRDEYVMLLTTHHMVSDAWSREVFLQELAVLYNAFVARQPSPLPDLPIQYVDFACWQRQWLQGKVLQTQLDYWTRQLQGVTTLELPTDRPRPAAQTFRGAYQALLLPASLGSELKRLGQGEGVTLFMTLFAAFQVLLSPYTGQDDISVGTPIANRTRAEIEGLIGFFTNTLVLRTDLSGNPTFLELLRRVREVALGAYAHQEVPFEKLVEVLQPKRDLSRSPLFQVMFILQHAPQSTQMLQDIMFDTLPHENATAKFDLTLSVIDTGQGLRSSVEYNTDLFDGTTIIRLLEHWRVLLASIASNPERHLADLPLLSETERQQVLVEWNATSTGAPNGQCVHENFEAQVARTPEAVALVFGDEQLTYRELNRRANRLAHYLQTLGVGPDVAVGICVERSLNMAVAVLAVLKAGGAYVPLDPAYPQERLAFMLVDAHVVVLLTQHWLLERLPEHSAKVVHLDSDWEIIAQERTTNPHSEVQAEHLTYVIYTSGSTGRPKGIGLSHHALVNLLEWHFSTLMVGARTLQFASLSFDASFHEMFATWCSGGTLFMISEALRRDVVGLMDFLSVVAIEKVILPVVVLQQLAEEYCVRGQVTNLQEVTTTGEQMQITPPIVEFFKAVDGCSLHNHYGPSESHVVTAYTLPQPSDCWSAHPPIGRPIANTQIYLLDQHVNPVPIGVPGELHIGGVSLARSYLNRPETTAERFIPNPFANVRGERLYKTGDRARYLADGNIEYLGRLDHQVKIRGYRIELGEIESVLSGHSGVHEVVVLAREDVAGDKRLVVYAVLNQEQPATSYDMRRYLQAKLPDYMLPSAFVMLASLPLTPNGKVDHRALPAPEHGRPELEVAFVAPRTPAEEVVAGVWAEILRVEQVGVYDNFFEVGGHSLLAAQVVSRLCNAFQIELPLRRLFEQPTVDGLVGEIAHLRGGREIVEEVAMVLMEIKQLSEDEVKKALQVKN
jgi:amino acid adenylation domain-containing protein